MFVEVNHVTEITEDLGKRVDVAYQARKDYKTISKEFSQTDGVQMEEIQDHCYLPENWSTRDGRYGLNNISRYF